MPWNEHLCTNGYPAAFTNTDAKNVVHRAGLDEPFWVTVAGNTKSAYWYVDHGGFTLCVVSNVHPQWGGAVAGHSYIPGWRNWQMDTPYDRVPVIDKYEVDDNPPAHIDLYPRPRRR